MTTKEYKKLCRIKANKLAKFITYCIQQLLLVVAWLLGLLSLANMILALISITLWFYAPDVIIHILENKYNLTHDKISYR
jgi:hypothetical protein